MKVCNCHPYYINTTNNFIPISNDYLKYLEIYEPAKKPC